MNEVKISLEVAAQVIDCVEARIRSYDTDIAAIDSGRTQTIEKRAALVSTLAELRASLGSTQAAVSKNGEQRLRRPKGHADKLIIEILKAHPWGLSMADIERKTTVNHATVYRTLTIAERNKGRFRFEANGKLWKMGLSSPDADHR